MESEEQVIYKSSLFHLGRYRCPPTARAWHVENQSGDAPIFVFPRVPVHIHQLGRDSILATPNDIVLYNPGQPYQRRVVDPRGDVCEYIGLSPAAKPYFGVSRGRWQNASTSPRSAGLFHRSHFPCSSRIYLAQRSLFRLAGEAATLDRLELEERFAGLLPALVAITNGDSNTDPIGAVAKDLGPERVIEVQERIGRRFKTPLTLEELVDGLDCSIFQMCRSFKKRTGYTIYGYLKKLRLMSSLEQVLETDRSLTEIALDYQFSSHSHYTSAFRKFFGVPPSAIRKQSLRSVNR